jgi:hypothetical protein
VSTRHHLGIALERALDAAVLAVLILVAIYTSSTLERLGVLVAAALLLLGWLAAWYRRKSK